MKHTKEITCFEHHIRKSLDTLKISWKVIDLLIAIERFDAQWSSIWQKEASLIEDLPNVINSHLFYEEVKSQIELGHKEVFRSLDALIFWYESDLDIQPLLKCLLFGFFVHQILISYENTSELGFQSAIVLLFESGYTWIKFFKLSSISGSNIEEWSSLFLSSLRDGQLLLLRKLDLYGVTSKLTLKEKLLLHILENNKGIKTTAMARKLCLSRATIKRMLNIFRERQIIEMRGVNRGIYYHVF